MATPDEQSPLVGLTAPLVGLTAGLPPVKWPSDAPDGLWVCGCGEVHIHYKKIAMPHGECFCVNCQVQIKVAKSKQKADYNYCNSPDTGARWMTQAFMSDIEFKKGADKLAYYRCAVTANGESTGLPYAKDAPGEEYKELTEFHNVITSCCGTYVGIINVGHTWIIDIDNPWRIKGWKPKPKSERLFFSVSKAHVVGLQHDGQGYTIGPPTEDPATLTCCCEVCKGCCGCPTVLMGPCGSCCRIVGDKCGCCKMVIPHPGFAIAPMGATELDGKKMEYITDPTFLKPKADPPSQMTMQR